MYRLRTFLVLITSAALIAACGDETDSGASTVATTTSTAAPTMAVPTTVAPSTAPDATGPTPAATQPAVWPTASVTFTTPEAAAADFLATVFDDGPMLGEFMVGDARSGEIEVFASENGAVIGDARSVLFLRQLGPDDGWFVVSAASDVATIAVPEVGSAVAPGSLTVEGVGTGFEATVVVSAFEAGRVENEFDREVTMAGNFGDVLPYAVELDLSDATTGDVVVLLVRGGAGLETDPGDFGAIPVVIG